MHRPLDSFDGVTHFWCSILGQPINFGYYRKANEGLSCFRALVCYESHFDVAGFFEQNYSNKNPGPSWPRVRARSCGSNTPWSAAEAGTSPPSNPRRPPLSSGMPYIERQAISLCGIRPYGWSHNRRRRRADGVLRGQGQPEPAALAVGRAPPLGAPPIAFSLQGAPT